MTDTDAAFGPVQDPGTLPHVKQKSGTTVLARRAKRGGPEMWVAWITYFSK